ncbi:MAG: leucine-rich repeat protein [Clostridia bacterium]|nr:leucine-rich repeat protein [Clostridia bacterium]
MKVKNHRSKKHILATVLALAMAVTSVCAAGVFAKDPATGKNLSSGLITSLGNLGFDISQHYGETVNKLPEGVDSDTEISVIVKHEGLSVLSAHQAANTGLSLGDYSISAEGLAVKSAVDATNRSLLKKIKRAGVSFTEGATYNTVLTGVEVVIKAGDLYKLEKAIGKSAIAIVSEEYEVSDAKVVENDVTVYETGIFDSSASEYDGTGVVIAVLDTGTDYTHTAFGLNNFTSTTLGMTKEDVAKYLGDTIAATKVPGLTAEDVYINEKMPYGFDYADNDSDVYPLRSTHGTHVAGVIVGKDDVITGVAPNAQLVTMKVFSDLKDSAKTSWILNALEDCVTLGVDVINMSLGTSCGFSREVDEERISAVYDSIKEAGISLVVAASNDYNSTHGSEKNGNLGLTSNPDSATVGSPSTYEAAISVASISGVKTPYMINNGEIVYFLEASDYAAKEKHFVDDILEDGEESRDFEFITVPGVGRAADYLSIDVTGKIALVSRGTTTFENKVEIALRNGAIGVIIYNNVSGDIRMSVGKVKDAVCSISQDDGERLAAQGTGILTINRKYLAGPFMSDFSSWGPTPDLKLKPEITAHGGEILSAVYGQDYERMSGTSMAAPNLAGVVTLVRQYVNEMLGSSASNVQKSAMVYQLLMSTTDIALNVNGLPYSVRKQGSGLANLLKATTTPVYITTYNEKGLMDKTKLELGDDPEKTGVYTMQVVLNNLKSTAYTFDVGAWVMTEGVSETETHQGETTVTEQGYLLSGASIKVTGVTGEGSSSGNSVTVNANGAATVTVTVALSDTDKAYLNDSFANGMYVEGFLTFGASKDSGAVNLNVPFLGFYGDWTQAPILDLDYFETNKDELDDSIDLLDKTLPDAYATRPIGGMQDDYINYMGSYAFAQNPAFSAISADRSHIALSNQEQAVSSIEYIYAGLLRSAARIDVSIVDDATGEEIFTKVIYNQRKSSSSGNTIYPSAVDIDFQMADYNLKNNSRYTFTMKTYLDYGDGGESTNVNNTFTFPFVTDFQAPAITDAQFYTEYDKTTEKTRLFVNLSVYDNHYAQALYIGQINLEQGDVDEDLDGELDMINMISTFGQYLTPVYSSENSTSVVTYELTDHLEKIKNGTYTNKFIVAAYDYALNEAYYEITVPEEMFMISFPEEEVVLSQYQTYTVKPNVYPSTDDVLASTLVYTSADESVAGMVGGKLIARAPGQTTITAVSSVDETITASFTVKVLGPEDEGYVMYTKPVAESFNVTGYFVNLAFYALSSEDREIGETGNERAFGSFPFLSMFPSEKVTLKYDLMAYFPDEVEVEFTSSNEDIVTVDKTTGQITAKSEGNAIIIAQVLSNGEITRQATTIDVAVKNPYETSGSFLMSYKGLGGVVTIPESLSLTEIYIYAFSNYEYVLKGPEDEISEEDPYLSKPVFLGENDDVTKVIIPEGVTTIHDYAFAGMEGLKEIVLPSTIKTIGRGAFYGCTNLTTVTGLKYVKFVGQEAFYNCKIKAVEFERLVAIGDRGFAYNDIQRVTLPNSAQSLGVSAFSNNNELEEVVINASKIKLGSYAFENCSLLERISINASVIPSYTFSGCSALKEVELGADVSVIGEYAFAGTAITSFTVAQGNTAFAAQNNGAYLLSPDGTELVMVATGVTTSFSLASDVAANVTKIASGAFAGFDKLRSVNLPAVTTVGDYAFAGCSLLVNVSLGNVSYIGAHAYEGTGISAVNHANATFVGEYAFKDCTSLMSASLPQITELPVGIFEGCSLLGNVTVGQLTAVGNYAFYKTGLLTMPDISKVTTIGEYAFAKTQVAEVTIPSNAVVGAYAFMDCELLATVTIGDNVTLAAYAFARKVNNDSVTGIAYHYQATDENGKVFNATYYRPVISSALTSLTIGKNASIGEYAFASATALETVTLGEGATIGSYAFYNAKSLKEIDLSKVTVIGSYAFYGDGYYHFTQDGNPAASIDGYYIIEYFRPQIESVDLSSATEIGAYAFYTCTQLKTVVLGEQIKNIPDGAFYATAIEAIDLSNVETIGDYALANTMLTKVDLSSIVTIGEYAFNHAPVEEVVLGASVTKLGNNPFANTKIATFAKTEQNSVGQDEVIDTYTISETVFVSNGVLYQVLPNGLYELVTYPTMKEDRNYAVLDNTARISGAAFVANGFLAGVELPFSLKAIGDKAFYQCTALNVVTFKSLQAPVLEEEYDESHLTYNYVPFTGEIEFNDGTKIDGLGIVPFYMWNFTQPSNFYYGATFIDYVGTVNSKLVMVRPVNGLNYETFITSQYFSSVIDGVAAPFAETLAAIEAIKQIPTANLTLADKATVEAARAAFNKVGTAEQQALVSNYSDLVAAENVIAYLENSGSGSEEPEVTPSQDANATDRNVGNVLAIVFGALALVFAAIAAFCVVQTVKVKAKNNTKSEDSEDHDEEN